MYRFFYQTHRRNRMALNINDEERETLLANNVKASEVTRLLPLKIALQTLRPDIDWMQIGTMTSQEAYDEDMFWGSLRNELTAYVINKSMTQSTIHSLFSTIRKYISTAFPDLECVARKYIVASFKKAVPASSTETPKWDLLMKELRGRILSRTNQKSELTVGQTLKTASTLLKAFDIQLETMDADRGIDLLAETVQCILDDEDTLFAHIEAAHKDEAARIGVLLSKVIPGISSNICERTSDIVASKKSSAKTKPVDDDVDQQRFTSDEVDAMEKQCQCTRDKLIFYLFFTTGLRASGLARIRLDQVTTRVNNEWSVNLFGKTLEKGGKIRTFPLNQTVRELTLRWIQHERRCTDNVHLFPGQYEATHLSAKYIWSLFHDLALAAGVPRVRAHPHAARHTVAFLMAEQGVDMDMLARFLGHASGATTEKYYVKYAAHENVTKMQIPWLQDIVASVVPPTAPRCLIQPTTASSSSNSTSSKRKDADDQKKDRKKKKIQKTLNTIMSMQQAMLSK